MITSLHNHADSPDTGTCLSPLTSRKIFLLFAHSGIYFDVKRCLLGFKDQASASHLGVSMGNGCWDESSREDLEFEGNPSEV